MKTDRPLDHEELEIDLDLTESPGPETPADRTQECISMIINHSTMLSVDTKTYIDDLVTARKEELMTEIGSLKKLIVDSYEASYGIPIYNDGDESGFEKHTTEENTARQTTKRKFDEDSDYFDCEENEAFRGYKSAKQTHGNLEDSESIHTENQSLRDKLANLTKENKSLREIITSNQALEDSSTASATRIEQLENQVSKLKYQKQRFKEMVLKNGAGNSEAISDDDITGKFADLRAQIENLVSMFFRLDQNSQLDLQRGALNGHQRRVYDAWGRKLDSTELRQRLRAMAFKLLQEKIMNKPCFGLKSAGVQDIEQALVEFETRLLRNKSGHEHEIVEWRTRTIKCAALLSTQEPITGSVPHEIHDMMEPFMFVRSDIEKTADRWVRYESALVRLCIGAAKFALLTRGCKEAYKIEFPAPGSVPGPESSIVSTETSHMLRAGYNPGVIAFSIAGMLVKYPEGSDERLVLEEAHIVVQK